MYNFTILERMVLESINKGDKGLYEIVEDTGLEQKVCENVLYSLMAKGLIKISGTKYIISDNLSEGIIAELKNQLNMTVEINTLVRECVKSSLMEGEDSFKFKKVYMSESDKKFLKGMLYNLESFLDGLKNNKGATKEETFIFWGGENYAKAVNKYIS
ncbi:MAG: hypothetical protein CME64_04300 [Halobacteriovoraceae bacterium]|nr:hypothetical protein [Halobacteriovoraceae bacterium]|tara:strand:+ start:141565 stop:142038 length:474 start_codon:yes stop_codon:yes gene_type:complete